MDFHESGIGDDAPGSGTGMDDFDELVSLESYADRSTLLPLSSGQRRLWVLDQLSSNPQNYNVPVCVRLSGVVDVGALGRALGVVVGRHESLRTVFEVRGGEPVQRVVGVGEVSWSLLECVDVVSGGELGVVSEWVGRPFDLSVGPVLRAIVVRSGPVDAVFGLCVHHIAVDGWSLGIVLDEVSRCYSGFVSGVGVDLPVVGVGYADFAVWQREWLLGGGVGGGLGYWEGVLGGVSGLLELPWDRGRGAVPGFRGEVCVVGVGGELVGLLRGVGLGGGATLFMVLLAAFKVVLAWWSGCGDVVVGSPVAGRGRVELESVVGFFVNTVVLRSVVGLGVGFGEVLAGVRDVVLGAFAFQDVPFEVLVDRLAPERELSHNPLFQVLFALQNAPVGGLELTGLTVEPMNVAPVTSQFDLSVGWADHGDDGLVGTILYDPDLFDRATIERLGEHYLAVLAAVARDTTTPIRDLPLLSARERDEILAKSTGAVTPPARQLVHELIARQAARRPDALAVSDGRSSLTYAELDSRANQVAHHLLGLGVQPDSPVAVIIPRSLDLVVSLLGVMKAGAGYVPIDPASPLERAESMLRQARPAAVLAVSATADRVPAGEDRKVVLVDAEIGDEPGSAPGVFVRGDSLAYIIFTSGSTGEPKGAMNHHNGLSNLCDFNRIRFGQTENDRIAVLSAVSFDALVVEIWTNLTCGASLHIVEDATRTDPVLLREFLLSRRITRSFVPSPLVPAMAEQDWPDDTPLRTVLTGGDRLHWPAKPRPWSLHNNYGPTETTVTATSYVAEPFDGCRDFPPVGPPIHNVRTYVLDEAMRPQPLGTAGTLYIGGVGVGRGYVGDPALTAARFVPDPFGPPGSVMYDSGDSARLLPSGDLDFLGRLDGQVKIRGFRVEPAEVEAALRGHPLVTEAVVVPLDLPGRGRELVGYLQVPQGELTPSAVRAYVKDLLPSYMIPARFVVLGRLPLTDRGKIDRTALPQPELRETVLAAPDPAEPGSAGELVAAAWRSVLGNDEFGPDDNFFDVGGNSLLVSALAERLRDTFVMELALVELFANPTVRTQTDLVRQRGTAAAQENDDEAGEWPAAIRTRRVRWSDDLEADLDD